MLPTEKIETLTEEQAAYLSVYRENWFKTGISTSPIDYEKSKEIISDFYHRLEKPAPKFFKFSSPLTCELAYSFLKIFLSNKDQLWDRLVGQLGDQLGDQLEDQLGGQLRHQLWDQLWNQLEDQLEDQLGDQLGHQLFENLKKSNFLRNNFYAQSIIYWVAFYSFCSHIGVKYSNAQLELLNKWKEISESCFWWAPFNGICLISERPNFISFDDQNRLHNDEKMAISFNDGWGIYAIHGIRVPEYIVLRPEEITVEKIEAENNAEIRRVMINRYDREFKKSMRRNLNHDSM